jgi:hypothetical protein
VSAAVATLGDAAAVALSDEEGAGACEPVPPLQAAMRRQATGATERPG